MKYSFAFLLVLLLGVNHCQSQSFKELQNKDLIGDDNEYFRFTDDTTVYIYLSDWRYYYGTYYLSKDSLIINRKATEYSKEFNYNYKILLRNKDSLFICIKKENKQRGNFYDTIRLINLDRQITSIKKLNYIEYTCVGGFVPYFQDKIVIDSSGNIWYNNSYRLNDTAKGKFVYRLNNEELNSLIKLLEVSILGKLRKGILKADDAPFLNITVSVDNRIYKTNWVLPDFIHERLYSYLYSICKKREIDLTLFNEKSKTRFYDF